MDEIAGIKIVIEAEDRASAVISGVDASVSELGRAQGAVSGQAAAFNAAMNGSARSSAVLGSSVTQTKNNLKQLESGMSQQKNTTLEYTKSLRDSGIALKEKQAAVQSAARAYKVNTASIKENISGLENQRTKLDALTSINDEIISRATEQNKSLKRNSAAYKENAETIKRVRAENKEYAAQRREITQSISDNEAALRKEATAYHDAQAAVKNAAAVHSEMRDMVHKSKAIEADYESAISKTNTELESRQREYEKLQKAENLIETGGAWKKVGGSIDEITKPLQVASVAAVALGTASAVAAVNFEDNFASVKKTVDGTPEQLDKIKQEIIDMSTVGINGHNAIPQTTAELTALAAAGGQLGIQTENISAFTENMAMLGSATNLYGEQGAQTIARFMNVTNTSQEEIANLGSAIVELGNNFATTEAEIADMALNMGATGNVVGISAQDVLAYSTALSSLGVDAAAGGSAVSRIWMDIQSAVSAGGDSLQKFAKLSGMSSEEFKQQWQNDASGAFQKFLKGLNNDKDQISTLSELGFNNIRDIQALQRLAGEKGFNLLTEAIERSNTAWSENTALQTEFDAKAETTASKLAVAKNNAVEAARSLGQIMLPTIVDVTSAASSFTQKLAGMNDSGKKAIVTAGAVTVGLGALSKGAASTIKTVGGVMEGYGEIKKAMTAGGALAKFAPMLIAIGSAALPAAAGIAGVTAAVVVGKKAYDAWYNSNYKFTEGLSENVEQLKSYKNRMQELNDLRWEYNDLSGKISSGDFSGGELDSAKLRLDEIKAILQDKYKIDVDSGDIDDAIEKTEKLEKLDFYNQKKKLRNDIDDLAPNYEKALKNLPQLEAEYAQAQQAAQAFSDTTLQVAEWQDDYEKGAITAEDYTAQFVETLNSLGKAFLDNDKFGAQMLSSYKEKYGDNLEYLSAMAQLNLSGLEDGLHIEELEKKISDAEQAVQEYKESVQALTSIDLSELKDDFASGVVNESTAGAEIDAIVEKMSVLDSRLKKLRENGKIDVKFNMDTGGLDIFDLDGNKLGEITADGKVVFTVDDSEVEDYVAPDKDGTAKYSPDGSEVDKWTPPEKRGSVIYEAVMPEQFKNSNYGQFGVSVFRKAKGDSNFAGGNALLNDDGSADPRELILHDGLAYMYNAPNVIANVPKHATILTSAQTKAKLRQMGITSYAGGKNNSDAFTTAKDDWTHYTKTHAVTTAQELQKWLEFQEQYKENEKDIWDIEEQVFSLQQKLYSERVKESENWLRHEEKYNGMGADGYIAGIDRMKAYTADYYAQGIISHKEYTEAIADLDEKYLDKRKEQLSELYDLSTAYISEHTYFNDWEDNGDNPLDAYNRVMDRNREALANGELTQKEYDDYASKLGSDMLSERIEQSKNWLAEQREYFGISDAEYVEGLERIKTYTQEYYDKGIINRREYNEAMTDLNHSMWDEALSAYDDMLQKQQDYISDMRDEFSKQEQELQDSWTVEDRKADMSEVSAQLDIYAGSVTDAGQKKYAELEKEMQQLQRDEELYNLQVRNNATIEGLEADYKILEENKKNILNDLRATDIDISGYVDSLTQNISQSSSNIEGLLGQLISKFDNFKVESTSMSDNRKISYSFSQMTPEQIQSILNEVIGR